VNRFAIRLLHQDGRTVEIHGPADITRETTDAIVNAANSQLMGGGGVDGAIHKAGGPAILQECRRIVAERGHLPAGQAVMTTGGQLPAKYVIHTVGPVYRGGKNGEAEILASCYEKSLHLAQERQISSIAFPSISTGAYRYPVGDAARIALRSIIATLVETTSVLTVRLVLFDTATRNAYERAVEQIVETGSVSSYTLERGAA
jgi:O-acetyl-ADP-ribose deacetylase (regulator of RNase III)